MKAFCTLMLAKICGLPGACSRALSTSPCIPCVCTCSSQAERDVCHLSRRIVGWLAYLLHQTI